MKLIKTTCARDCYDACGMIFKLNQNEEIEEIKGDPDHPITQGFLCPRGSKDNERLLKNRVSEPLIRKGKDLVNTDWKNIIDRVSDKITNSIENYGSHSVLYVDFAGNEGLIHNYFVKRLWHLLNVSFTDQAICTASGHFALNLHYGASYGVQPLELLKKQLIVFWGFNAAVSAPHIWKLAKRAVKENNAKVVVIDIIKTLSAKTADLFIQIKPNSDVSLAYAIINSLISKNAVDLRFLEQFASGYDMLKLVTSTYSIEKTYECTGIDKKDIEKLVEMYNSSSKNSATMIGVALQKRENGIDPIRAISFIPTILGIHRGFFYSNGSSLYINSDYIAGKHLSTQASIVKQVSIADYLHSGKVKMLFINSMNAFVSLPNYYKILEAIKIHKIFVVVCETHMSETAKLADVVLPVPTFLEKEDYMPSWSHNFIRKSNIVSKRVTNSKTEVEIMRLLAQSLKIKNEEIFAEPEAVIKEAFKNTGVNLDKLINNEAELQEMKVKPNDVYPTPSHRIEFFSNEAEKMGFDGIPKQCTIPKLQDNEFILATTTILKYTNSQFKEVYGEIDPSIFMFPDDAQRLKLAEGTKVEVSNNQGRLVFILKLDANLQKGLVWAPRFINDLGGLPINILTSSTPQKFGNGPKFHSTIVEIKSL